MIDQEIQEAEARGMEEDVDRSVVEEGEGLKVMASESMDKENQGLGESGSKKCSGEKSVENMVEVVDHGIEEKQETKRMKDFEEGMIVEAGESESKKRKVMTVEKKLVKKQAKKVKGEKKEGASEKGQAIEEQLFVHSAKSWCSSKWLCHRGTDRCGHQRAEE